MIRAFSLFIICMSFEFLSGQIMLEVAHVNGTPDSSVILPVGISDGEEVTAIQFDIDFDPEVLSLAENSAVLSGNSIVDHSVGSSEEGGNLTIVITSASLKTLEAGPGTLVQLVFQVNSEAPADSVSAVEISKIQASDPEGNPLGVFGSSGSVTISQELNSPGEGQNTLIFPQIANGSFDGGSFGVTMIFVNRTQASSTGRVDLFQSDGTPFEVVLTDGRQGASFEFDLSPGGSVFLETDGSGALSAGYAVLNATGPLGGALLFTSRNDGHRVLTETGVGASPQGRKFSIPLLLERGATNTGIALVNRFSSGQDVTLILRDEQGFEVAREEISLEAGEHLPRFSDEFFEELVDTVSFRGSIEVVAAEVIAAVALKVQGALLTTFPVVVLT